jgi:hypothetical protein
MAILWSVLVDLLAIKNQPSL